MSSKKHPSIDAGKTGLSSSARACAAGLALVLGCLGAAHANIYTVTAAAAGLTNVAKDGKCNLTEAILSLEQGGPVNTDCVPQNSTTLKVVLSGANTVFQVAAGTTNYMDVQIATTDAGVVIEAAGTPLRTLDGSLLTLTGPSSKMTLRVKSGSTGRAIFAGGDLNATNVIFQGANVSGISGDDAGGVIYSVEGLTLTGCTVQGGTAVNGGGLYMAGGTATLQQVTIQNNQASQAGGGVDIATGSGLLQCQRCIIQSNTATKQGGGAFNNGQMYFNFSVIKGNKAGQGGGLFDYKPYNGGSSTNFFLTSSTVSDNKAIATELTPVPGPTGTSITGSQTACNAQTETASQAFDGDLATKWCNSAPNAPSADTPHSLTYMLPSGSSMVVSAYSITSANDAPERDPKDWMLQGYDGAHWIPLHTITGYSFTASASNQRYLTESFNDYIGPDFQTHFDNTTAYKGYRLVVTQNAGNSNKTQIAELQLFPRGQTGDGGGVFTLGHMNLTNSTLSGNIAGCNNASCACTAAFCTAASNTSTALGKGGGLYAGNPPPESDIEYLTVAGNSASQGGGVYADHNDHWGWSWSLIGKNSARATKIPEPDFHGAPHSFFMWHEDFIQNTAGANNLDTFSGDVTGADPKLDALADNGGQYTDVHPLTHALQTGSPALDKVLTPNGNVTVDERGTARPQGAKPDFGAFEKK